jgi:ATP-dependent DNA helicase RecG
VYETITADLKEIKSILNRSESYLLDFKSKDISPAKLQLHFVAFANADGGDLYVGVDEHNSDFLENGFAKPEDANNLISVVLGNTSPSVEGVVIEFIKAPSSRLILHILVPKSEMVHYTSTGDCYVRINASSEKIKGEEIVRLGYSKGIYKYEEQPVRSAEISDIIESSYLKDYLSRLSSTQDPMRFLRRNKLLASYDNETCPSVACVLLFDSEPQEVISNKCSIKIIRLQTTSEDYNRAQLAVNETLVGPIEEITKAAEKRIWQIMEESTFMIEDNQVKVSYPVEAVHEILVNAVLHRDYSRSDDIHVTIYDNRIEVRSPGRLAGNVTVDNILDSHFNRNANLVRMINKLPDPINHDLGEGLNTAFRALRNAGLVKPQIEEIENSVLVKILHKKLASYEDQIMEYLETHPFVTNKIARAITGEGSENRIKNSFKKLREAGKKRILDPSARKFDYKYVLKS